MHYEYDPWPDVDDRLDLEYALAQLSPRQRRVLTLWAQGYTQEEMAEEYGVTQVAVHYWIEDATYILRPILFVVSEG